MTSISDTIRLTNQALENALTTASVPKITASDKHTAIHHRQQPATKSNGKVTKKTLADDAKLETEKPDDEEEIKHIDIRI